MAADDDLAHVREALENAQVALRTTERRPQRWNRRTVAYWRTFLSVAAASRRAAAGDRTAARRLAWRVEVLEARKHIDSLLRRLKAHQTRLARLVRNGPPCASCIGEHERARQRVSYYLDQVAALPGTVRTYADYRRVVERSTADAEAWLRRQLEGLRNA